MSLGEVIKLNGQGYRVTKKLNAMEQFHVTRRLGPALMIVGVSLRDMLTTGAVGMDAMSGIAGPVIDIVSHMSDEDVEYVIRTCMKTVERMQGSSFAPVMTPDGSAFMFTDMDQAEMIRMTIEVLQINLANFMTGVPEDANSANA